MAAVYGKRYGLDISVRQDPMRAEISLVARKNGKEAQASLSKLQIATARDPGYLVKECMDYLRRSLNGPESELVSATYSIATSVSSLSTIFPTFPDPYGYEWRTYDELKSAAGMSDAPRAKPKAKPKPKPKPKLVAPPTGRVIDLGD